MFREYGMLRRSVLQSTALSCNPSCFLKWGIVCGDDCVAGGANIACSGALGGELCALV